jgi:hypothetical protein
LTTASEEGRGQDDDIIRVVALDNEEEMRATVEVEKEKEKRFFY